MIEIRRRYGSSPEHQLEGALVLTFVGLPRRHPCAAIEGHTMVLYMVSWTFCASLALFLSTYLFFRSMYLVPHLAMAVSQRRFCIFFDKCCFLLVFIYSL